MKYDSIAMIETNGLVSSIAALDAMLKLENITYIRSKVITNGQVTVFISGNIAHLKHVVLAGKVAANEVGNVISSAIIENPTKDILNIILDKKEEKPKARSKPKKVVTTDKSLTLFDEVFENPIVSESQKKNKDINYILEEESFEEVNKIEVDDSTEKIKDVLNLEKENSNEPINEQKINTSKAVGVEKEQPINTPEEIEVEKEQPINIPEEIEIEKEEPINTPEEIEIEKEQPIITSEEIEENISTLSHLDRLRAEAKLEIEKENQNSIIPQELNDEHNKKVEKISKARKSKKVKSKKLIVLSDSNLEEVKSDITKMNVPQLRKLARGNPKFPIKGREISKANRLELLSYFSQLEN